MTTALAIVGIASIALGLGALAFLFVRDDVEVPARLGLRGLERSRALERGGLFSFAEPLIRSIARLMKIAPASLRARLDRTLMHAGDYLGLSAEELLATCLLSGAALGGIGLLLVEWAGLPALVPTFLLALGIAAPYLLVTGEVSRRRDHVDRALPAVIDLVALCMGAGLDFPAAVRKVVDQAGWSDDPLADELSHVLSRLGIGETRRAALIAFSERVPTPTVRAFVTAVVQSEEKGTPLVETLRIQGETLRNQRTVAGEEAASRAAVLMMVPLMLILSAVVLVLLGPFLIHGAGAGL